SLPASVDLLYRVDLNGGDAGIEHPKLPRGTAREVELPTLDERTAVIDSHRDRLATVGDTQSGAERQCLVRSRQTVPSVRLTVGCLIALPIVGRDHRAGMGRGSECQRQSSSSEHCSFTHHQFHFSLWMAIAPAALGPFGAWRLDDAPRM